MPTINGRRSELERLYTSYETDARQRFLENGSLEFVRGFGSCESSVMLIGEAPGKDEVLQGKPFVGKAGKILTAFLEGAGLERDDLFITNTVKYRLSKAGARPGSLVNRPARREEIVFSAAYLKREAEILHPKAVVTLGNVPLKAVLYLSQSETAHVRFSSLPDVGAVHGTPIKNAFGLKDIWLFPLYHPASVIYNRALENAYREDLKKFFVFFRNF